MAGRQGNKAWLRQQLQKTLQWDAEAAEAVVEAVAVAAASGNSSEMGDLVEAYMGGNPTAHQLVNQFCGVPPGGGARASGSGGGGGGSGGRQASCAGEQRGSGSGSGSGRARPATVEPPPPAERPKPVLDMGPNIRTTVKPAKKKAVPAVGAAAGAAGGGGSSSGAGGARSGVGKQLERPVVNCLRCGKIYDCRAQAGEALRFLASGGVCSFCGNHVALRYADGTSNAAEAGWAAPADPIAADSSAAASASQAPAPAAGAAAAAGELAGFDPEEQQGNAAGSVAYNTSAAAAVALRDRLVEYDRQSAKRTTVLDDQSDFFEIDANAWLTDEERAVLKQREVDAAEAEEARRKRVTVTVDLLGRKVILDSNSDPTAADGGKQAAAALEAQLEAARGAATARAAAAATAAEAAQGGGGAAATVLAAVEDKLQNLRITVNPSMAARHFVFLPQQHAQPVQQQRRQQPSEQEQHTAAVPAAGPTDRQQATAAGASGQGGSRGQQQQQQRLPQRRAHGAGGLSRLQHDDPFELDTGAAAAPAALAAA